jgi:HSP20 family protein
MEEIMNLRQLTPFRDRSTLAPASMAPFGLLQREVERLFDEFARGLPHLSDSGDPNLVPSIDVSEDDKQIEVTVEMPGLERKDVDITLQDDVLVIRGEKRTEAQRSAGKDKQSDKSKNYQVIERS